MTTKVTVDAHAGWPVKVVLGNPVYKDAEEQEIIVQPNTVREFYVHDSLNIILIEEMKRD